MILKVVKRFSWLVVGAAYLAIGVASFLPNARLWGINHLAFYSPITRFVALGLIAVTFVPFVHRSVFDGLTTLASRRAHGPRPMLLGFIAVAALVVFYAFQSSTLLLGDGQLIANELSTHFQGAPVGERLRLIASTERISNGTSLLYFLTTLVQGHISELDPVRGIRFTNMLLGCLLVVVCCLALVRSSAPAAVKLWVIVLVATAGTVQLFFGYVENYTPMIFFGVLYVLSAVRLLGGEGTLWPPLVALALSIFCHIQATLLLPSFLFLLLERRASKAHGSMRLPAVPAILALTAAAFVVGAFTPLRRFYLPPVATGEVYGILSPSHLVDIVNELWLLLPTLPLAVALTVGVRRRDKGEVDTAPGSWEVGRFAVLLLVPSLLFLIVFNPEIGMSRDWDLFSITSLGLVLLSCLVVRSVVTMSPDTREFLPVPALAMSVVMVVAWIGINASESRSIDRFERTLVYDSSRADYALENLARAYAEQSRFGEAVRVMEGATAESANPRHHMMLSHYYRLHGDVASADAVLETILSRLPRYPGARRILLVSLFERELFEEAARVADTGTEVESGKGIFYYYLGKSLLQLDQVQAGREALFQGKIRGLPQPLASDADAELKRTEAVD